MIGELNEQQISEVLKSQSVGRIGCHFDETTYVVPVSYVFDGEYIYAHSREGMKIKMMRQNPQVCFEVEEVESGASWRSVIAWGEYEELQDEEDRDAAMKLLVKHFLPSIQNESILLSHGLGTYKVAVVYRIRLTKKVGRFEKH
ncbi:Pyridoxamine 5'-phosphate oxidase [compost metagenome]